MKKILQVIGLATFIGFASQTASAVEFDEGIFHYTSIEESDGDVKVSLKEGATVPAEVVIPTEVTFLGKTYTVTHLGGWMFQNNTTLEKVTLPGRMTTFEYAVFEGCSNLTSCPLPESLKWIGNYCFKGCANLKDFTIPENVEYIGPNALVDAFKQSPLAELVIPDAVTTIGNNAFMGALISRIVFGKGISEIAEGLCAWCDKLEDIVMPHNIKVISPWAFQGCSFTKVNVGAPEVIGANVFADSYTTIEEVRCEATTVPVCVETSFPDAAYEGTLIVPDEAVDAYKADAVWGKFATIKGVEAAGIDDIITGEGFITNGNASTEVYNLQGVRVASSLEMVAAPGMYIAGGKKVLVK